MTCLFIPNITISFARTLRFLQNTNGSEQIALKGKKTVDLIRFGKTTFYEKNKNKIMSVQKIILTSFGGWSNIFRLWLTLHHKSFIHCWHQTMALTRNKLWFSDPQLYSWFHNLMSVSRNFCVIAANEYYIWILIRSQSPNAIISLF